MILSENHVFSELNEYLRHRIKKQFNNLETISHTDYLSLSKYVNGTPERFYSKKSFHDYRKFLFSLSQNDRKILFSILRNYSISLNTAFKALDEINFEKSHDNLLPSNEYEFMLFLENRIHPHYLKLTESVFSHLILPISGFFRLKRNVKLEGFDVYNRAEELKGSDFSYLLTVYDNTIRNAIAHCNVEYRNIEVTYRDKKQFKTHGHREIVTILDDYLDYCNGLAAALNVFYLCNLDTFEEHDIKLPEYIFIAELKAETKAPGWEVIGCLEGFNINDVKQLNIFTENKFLNSAKLNYYVLRTVILAEKFDPGYKRYFFHLKSKYGLDGWAGFDGDILKSLRQSRTESLDEYIKAIENNLIFFVPKLKLPQFLSSISNLFSILKISVPLNLKKSFENLYGFNIIPRVAKIHRSGFYSIINGTVYIEIISDTNILDFIRQNKKRILKKVIKIARRRAKFYDISRYLRIGYLRINIVTSDFRKRKLEGPGLIPELLATFEFIRLKRIRSINISDGIPENMGKFKIVWNSKSMYIEVVS